MRGFVCQWVLGVFAWGSVAGPALGGVTFTGDTQDDGTRFYAGYAVNSTGGLVIDAGSIFSRSNGYLGYATGSTGSGVVTGRISQWTSSSLYIGFGGSGVLSVEGGGQVTDAGGYLGYNSGAAGTATVTGAGSKWTNSGALYIGPAGNGTLTVSNGGLASAKTLYASLSDLAGDSTINANGAVLDTDLVFDATHSATQALAFGAGGTLQLGFDGTGALGAGYRHFGSLRIADGQSVTSTGGYLGYSSGSTGTATVTGAGSKWTDSGPLVVGDSGGGTLRMDAGGQVSSASGYLGYNSGTVGEVMVTGAKSKWTNSGELHIGSSGSGTLKMDAGGQVVSSTAYLGYSSAGIGSATVTGAGSQWSNSTLHVGSSGSGTLNVENGGQVRNGAAYLGYFEGSSGRAIVTGAGSKWTNSDVLYVGLSGSGMLTVADGGLVTAKTLYASLSDLHGNGTITLQGGAVLDTDLVFDATHSATQALAFGAGGTLQLGFDGTGALGAGYRQFGSLRIAEGQWLASSGGYLGYNSGSTGTATVTGVGSKWTTGSLNVGNSGRGTLRVEAGGEISNGGNGYVGFKSGSSGSVTVTGNGSRWTNASIIVGSSGSGTLSVEAGGQIGSDWSYIGSSPGSWGTATVTGNGSKWTTARDLTIGSGGSSGAALGVSDGGQVTATALSIKNSQSTVRVHVSGDAMLVLGSSSTVGGITNNGQFEFLADALLPAGIYRPIGEYAGRNLNWSGNGSTSAVGGVWDSAAKTFTVVAPTVVDAGVAAAVGSGQRLLISAAAGGGQAAEAVGGYTHPSEMVGEYTHPTVGVSFGALISGTSLTGSLSSSSESAGLVPLLGAGETMLGGWDFAGALAGGEALVSFKVGLGASDVRVWRLSQDVWSAYTPQMMTYDAHGVVSFTVDPASLNGGGYAVSGVVPEPGVMGMLAVASLILLSRRRVARTL